MVMQGTAVEAVVVVEIVLMVDVVFCESFYFLSLLSPSVLFSPPLLALRPPPPPPPAVIRCKATGDKRPLFFLLHLQIVAASPAEKASTGRRGINPIAAPRKYCNLGPST